MTKLLELSRDQEISEWPRVRAKQKTHSQREKFTESVVKGPNLTPEQNLQALHDTIMQDLDHRDSLSWDVSQDVPWAAHDNQQNLVDIQTWF